MYKWGIGGGVLMMTGGLIFRDWMLFGIGVVCTVGSWIIKDN